MTTISPFMIFMAVGPQRCIVLQMGKVMKKKAMKCHCGAVLQDIEADEHSVLSYVYVRANLACFVPIEISYFAAGYEPLCYHCGQGDMFLVFGDIGGTKH